MWFLFIWYHLVPSVPCVNPPSNGLPPSSHWWMRLLVPLDQSVRLNVGSMTSTHILPLSMSIHSFSANNAFQVLMFLPGLDCPLRRQAYIVELIASETFSRVISSGGRDSLPNLPNLQRRGGRGSILSRGNN